MTAIQHYQKALWELLISKSMFQKLLDDVKTALEGLNELESNDSPKIESRFKTWKMPNEEKYRKVIERKMDAITTVKCTWEAILPQDRLGLVPPEEFKAPADFVAHPS